MSRSRVYDVVVNNWDANDYLVVSKLIENPHVRYVICGKEVGEEGTPHLQCMVMFTCLKTIEQVYVLIPNSSARELYSAVKFLHKYCKKDKEYEEWGQAPKQGQRNDLRSFVEGVKESEKRPDLLDILENTPHMIARYPRFTYHVLDTYHPPVTMDGELSNEWHSGPPGTGKSRFCRELHPDAYIKSCNKWWDNYNDQEYVIIEDFSRSHVCLGYHLKIWADRYPFPAESKGSMRLLRPARIYVTSNYSIADLFCDDHDLMLALERRFKQIPY